jgi:SsrA-binding protein
MAAKPNPDGRKIVAENRKARHDYHVLEEFEAGLELQGTEVKSLRAGQCVLRDAHVAIRNGQAYVVSMHIAPYLQGNIHNHDPERDRRLLLHRHEIEQLSAHIDRKGNALVALSIYFLRGRAKMAIGVARGKQNIDKRQTITDRDVKRQLQRELKEHNR